MLFRETEPPRAGRILDLGCGYGVIGLAIAVDRAGGAASTAVDVNERALSCSPTRTPASLGVADRFLATAPDAVPQDATYDEIWSNPPIRIGKVALHELLLTWLPRLAPGGRAVLVVGKNLGADSLQRWLVEQGLPHHPAGLAPRGSGCSRLAVPDGSAVKKRRVGGEEATGQRGARRRTGIRRPIAAVRSR